DNTLDFSGFGGPVTIDLSKTTPQVVNGSLGLTITLQDSQEINAVVDGAYDDAITGNASGDRFYVRSGNDTVTDGGQDTVYFVGSQLGSDVINESTPGNALNFYGFGGSINLDLKQTGAQVLSQGPGSNLTLTLSDPSQFNVVIGSAYSDTIKGNDAPNETL